MDEFKPNSHASKREASLNEKEKVQKVVTGAVKTKKKNEFRKFTDIFIAEDAKNVKSYVFMDVIVPAIKKAIADVVTDGISMLLYGGTKRGERPSAASKVSYRNYYDRRDDDRRTTSSSRTRNAYDYDDIILESRGEAEDVLSRMDELIETYGVVSVADLYDLVGISGNYTDNKYGWSNIRNAEPVRVQDGYMLKLPKVLPIN